MQVVKKRKRNAAKTGSSELRASHRRRRRRKHPSQHEFRSWVQCSPAGLLRSRRSRSGHGILLVLQHSMRFCLEGQGCHEGDAFEQFSETVWLDNVHTRQLLGHKTLLSLMNKEWRYYEKCLTARCFLKFMSGLEEVVIQDAAALAVLFPDCFAHLMYRLDVFRRKDFDTYKEEMSRHLERAKAPWDTSLEQFNAALNARLSGIGTRISACETVHQRNAALLYQLATESNQAIIKEIIKAQLGML